MNMQTMLKQAQKLQKEMISAQEEINNKEFIGKSSIVTAKMNGKRELMDIEIASDKIDLEDLELLQDMIVVAVNDALKQIEKTTEEKMGAYTRGMPGLF